MPIETRIDVTQSAILDRLVDFLRAELPLGERSCYLTINPAAVPVIPKGGDYFVTVSPGPGRFVEGEQVPVNVTEEWSITVTAFTRIKLDSTDHDKQVLLNAARGLIVLKRRLLKALVGVDLAIEADGAEGFLRNLLFAKSATRPEHGQWTGGEQMLSWISVDFGVDFDWDLT